MDADHTNEDSADIAIVGMGCRFPGARNIGQYWQNLRDGVESVTFFSEEELLAAGVAPSIIADKAFVRAGSLLEDCDRFDAEFFGFSPAEAVLMDPQIRILLECAWETMEDAACDPDRYPGRIGVFAGMSMNSYILNLASLGSHSRNGTALQARILNDKDFLSTWISYKLNLRGPSINVQTACSTSLVAVHLACQSLLSGESDMALAGGVTIDGVRQLGYFAYDGSILSPDGHCRAFDADAGGTVCGNGAGMVMLKRLQDARADGDTIHAVIKGSAVNNDGALKASYTAPSIEGQVAVIAEALGVSGVSADSIDYVEAHGTGTRLGDPAEISAISEVFASHTKRKGYCALGSVKSNIGHLDAAAGVAGLIKTVLALRAAQIPPSLHYQRPNPQIAFQDTPFFVNDRLRPWPQRAQQRRAAVSAFGVGGTNAHVVLEQAPARAPCPAPRRAQQLLLLSAKTDDALKRAALRLADFLEANPQSAMADVAYTLQHGRKAMKHRLSVAASSHQGAARMLREPDSLGASEAQECGGVVFMFSGQGAQYLRMASGLYDSEPVFRTTLDRCADTLLPHLGRDIRPLLFAEASDSASAALNNTGVAQPILFAVEYSLAALLASLGIRPTAMIGHSLGEYVAATLAGVMSERDALMLIAERARLMAALPSGAMLAVPLPQAQVAACLQSHSAAAPGCALAAHNSANSCVLSGPADQIEHMRQRLLAEHGVESRLLHTSHAFHSPMMAPMLPAFEARLRSITLKAPAIPFISSLTGTWISAQQATDARYWCRQLTECVRFHDGIGLLLRENHQLFLEIGPGNVLASAAQRHPDAARAHFIPFLRHARQSQDDVAFLLGAVGKAWQAGLAVDWTTLHDGKRQRLSLPSYPFQGRRYWLASAVTASAATDAEAAIGAANAHEHEVRPHANHVAPRDELEQLLADIWQQCLGVPQVGIHDDFFALGGQSLMASQLMVRVSEALGADCTVDLLFSAPTIAALAERIVELEVDDEDDVTLPA